jgi:hypothetical protein
MQSIARIAQHAHHVPTQSGVASHTTGRSMQHRHQQIDKGEHVLGWKNMEVPCPYQASKHHSVAMRFVTAVIDHQGAAALLEQHKWAHVSYVRWRCLIVKNSIPVAPSDTVCSNVLPMYAMGCLLLPWSELHQQSVSAQAHRHSHASNCPLQGHCKHLKQKASTSCPEPRLSQRCCGKKWQHPLMCMAAW